ncbi:MAG TPA: HupE/UreJ family protein [Planctomycetota bacterium]|nr:HupE/UreJ family protein [Planctomycetota bacterium]
MKATRHQISISLVLLLAFCLQWSLRSPARAHPLAQGFMELVAFRDKISIRTRVSLEEVMVSNAARVGDDDLYLVTPQMLEKHGHYLLKHWYLSADGKTLTGTLKSFEKPELPDGKVSPLDVQKTHVIYEMEYPVAAPPQKITISQDVLNEVNYAPGNPWEATYILRILQSEQEGLEGLLLTSKSPVTHSFKWSATEPPKPEEKTASPGAEAPKDKPEVPAARLATGTMAWNFLKLGIEHILTGYDHLLFVSALVLAAASFWELVKVVAAFTAAHTVTVTISALNIFSLPSNIVEPMIAASIVFIAVENIFWPKRSKGWGRLVAAFAFGLFHGLGFSSGLREAMEGMPTFAIVTAIIAFSVGVEIGHQVVVLPLFGLLKLVRDSRKEEVEREKVSAFALRYGSLVISAAGMFYLCAALGIIHSSDNQDEEHDTRPPAQQEG